MLLGLGLNLANSTVISAKWWQSLYDDPIMAADFRNNRYALNNSEDELSAVLANTRSSVKYIADIDGLYTLSPVNSLAINQLGLDISPALENISHYSNDATQWSVDGATISDPGVTVDMGAFTAKAADVVSNGAIWNRARFAFSSSFLNGTPFAIKIYYLSSTSGEVRIVFRDSGNGVESYLTGPVGNISLDTTDAGSVTQIRQTSFTSADGKTIYKFECLFTPNANSIGTFGIGPNSAVFGEGLRVVAGQVVVHPALTDSFILTSGSSVIQAADNITFVNPELYPISNTGTWFLKGQIRNPTTSADAFHMIRMRASASEDIQIYNGAVAGKLRTRITAGGIERADLVSDYTANQDFRYVCSYDVGNATSYYDSAQLQTGTPAALPTGAASIALGHDLASNNAFDGRIYDLVRWNTAKPNTFAQNL
ncbi:MAG: hypothetical protein AAF228_04735 [Pseudomonadota bacterium]